VKIQSTKEEIMKTLSVAKSVAAMLLALICSGTMVAQDAKAGGSAAKSIVVADVGLATPESVEYYAAEDVYLVTNINGSPFAVDGNGFISKLKPDGSVVALKWIDGTRKGVTLNGPKGAAIAGKNLFVADGNQVQVFALPGGKQKKSITLKGSTFLNGITPGPRGSVYVTDSGYDDGFAANGTDAIYQVWSSGKYKAIVKDKEMGHPNGIWDDKGRLVVNTFGTGKIFSVDKSGKQTAMPTPPNGGLDGLVKLKDGRLLVTSWGGSALYAMDKKGKFSVMADSLDAPADIGIDTKRHRVLIPLFKQNKVVILPY
jgi:hypothetical protein